MCFCVYGPHGRGQVIFYAVHELPYIGMRCPDIAGIVNLMSAIDDPLAVAVEDMVPVCRVHVPEPKQ